VSAPGSRIVISSKHERPVLEIPTCIQELTQSW
jgi:hypothetical protein